ncbi:MAG: hypothetical protein HZA52_04245 [Planctomycetes bacterium]|nr:hypothetical protein [Planctomycetota bacterium]
MSKKSDQTLKLLDKVSTGWPAPEKLESANLLEQGLYAILRRTLEAAHAATVVAALRANYSDWNELRVAQAQEICSHLDIPAKLKLDAARATKEYLQEVFQRSHGLELEFLRDDQQSAARFVSILPYIGLGTAHWLMWLASAEKEVPVTQGLVRVLDRLGLIARNSSSKKMRAAIDPLVPDGREVDFLLRFGEVGSRWCDARKPACYACPLVDDCRYGKKAFREWQVQQKRLEQQRVRDEARRAILAKKEEEKRKKEDEKRRREEERVAQKRAAVDARKRRETERLARIETKKRETEAKAKAKLEAAKKAAELEARRKADAEVKRVAAQKEAEKLAAKKKLADARAAEKKALAEKKAAEAKALADKKAAEAKALADKKAAEKKALAEKKAAEKKAAELKAAQSKLAAKKAAEKAAADKKEAARKLAEKKAAEKKAAAAKAKSAPKAKSAAKPAAKAKAAKSKNGGRR